MSPYLSWLKNVLLWHLSPQCFYRLPLSCRIAWKMCCFHFFFFLLIVFSFSMQCLWPAVTWTRAWVVPPGLRYPLQIGSCKSCPLCESWNRLLWEAETQKGRWGGNMPQAWASAVGIVPCDAPPPSWGACAAIMPVQPGQLFRIQYTLAKSKSFIQLILQTLWEAGKSNPTNKRFYHLVTLS